MIAELEEIHCKLSSLKAEKDSTKGAFFPVLNLGNKPLAGDKARDKQREVQDMELALKELTVICFPHYIFGLFFGNCLWNG